VSLSRAAVWRDDRLLIGALFVAVISELAMREIYHRAATETARLVQAPVAFTLLLLVAVVSGRLRSAAAGSMLSRVATCAAGMFALSVIAGWTISFSAQHHDRMLWISTAVTIVVILGAPDRLWHQMRLMLACGALAFVGSQPVIAMWSAPSIVWPSPAPSNARGPRRAATVALLLDELNAREGQAFERALEARGLRVASKRLRPVDRNTLQVVPAMFSGGHFGDAKPCSRSAVCSGANVLDFARIVASRPDIDVVGFYHPYCRIQGLRWCHDGAIDLQLMTSRDRWQCAVWRRTGWPLATSSDVCFGLFSAPMLALQAELADAVRDAPTITQGGMLFAHLPLPHPPGGSKPPSLEVDYAQNVSRAIRIVDDIVKRIQDAGLSPRVVLFSDHPLRQQSWCTMGHFPYAASGCTPVDALVDVEVPLIVAAQPDVELPSLQSIANNAQVFSVFREWPWRQASPDQPI